MTPLALGLATVAALEEEALTFRKIQAVAIARMAGPVNKERATQTRAAAMKRYNRLMRFETSKKGLPSTWNRNRFVHVLPSDSTPAEGILASAMNPPEAASEFTSPAWPAHSQQHAPLI